MSEATYLLNELELQRSRIESNARERRGRRISVEKAYKSLSAAGLSDLLVDCGPIQGSCIARSFWSVNGGAMMDQRGGDKLYHLAPLFSISVSANC